MIINLYITSVCFVILNNIQGFFINFRFGNNFSIKDKEIKKQIVYKLPFCQQNILNKFNGFYGMIGPDINYTNVNNLYDLFIGDGNIQGVFFDKGEITFVKHYIRTDKLLYEEKNGRIPNHSLIKLFFTICNKLNMLPNILGLANTAIMQINNYIYALYERDTPYKLNIDFHNKEITTLNKVNLPFIRHFSAHSKMHKQNIIETIDYDVLTNSVSYYNLNSKFEIMNKTKIFMNHLPIIHDFLTTKNNIIMLDSPFNIDFKNLFNKPLPVSLDINKKTNIMMLNKRDFTVEIFNTNKSFYLFHYADYKENDNFIEIYASLYDYIDFSSLNVSGKYRKIVINKKNKQVDIITKKEFEQLDLDFPIKFNNNKILFRSISNNRITGFVICNGFNIIKQISFENKFICGEPAINMIDETPYLIFFAFELYKNNKSYIIIINMNNYNIIEIPFQEQLNIGFHSLFCKNIE